MYYRDPSEFRERFKAYKDGKSVREIYGLPGYAGGTVGEDPELDMIKKYEGWRDKTYLDSKGIPTIGWGFTDSSLVSKGTMSRKEGDAYLSKRVLKRKAYLRNKLGPDIWDRLDTTTKAALLSYDHNYPAGFGDNTRFMKHWRAGRYNEAVSEMDAGMNDKSSPGLRPRRLDELAAVRKDSFLFPGVKSQRPVDTLILKSDATRVSPIPTVELKAIDYSDRRNAVVAEAERAMWAHNVMEDMKGAYQVPIWESPSLPALTPVEYDVTPLKTYAGGKVAEEDEPVIRQGTKGSRLDRFSRIMDPDEDDGTITRVMKKVGKGVADLVDDAKTISGLRTAERFATHTLSPGDYVDAAFLTVGNAMISKMLKASPKLYMKNFIQSFTDMDARALGKYFFLEHPELMTQPQEAWYGELAKKSDAYFRQAISHRAKLFDKAGKPLSPESIAAQISPDIKIAPIKGSRYGGIYSAPDNTMLINSDLVNDPRTAARVYNHERAHSMLTAFENEVGLPYPVNYGVEMEALFPFTAEQKAKRPGVHLGKEIDASLHEVKSLRSYDTDQLGRALDIDFLNMSDEEFRLYANNGYFKDVMLNILNGLQAQKKFISKLKNGKLPRYYEGELPMGEKKQLTDEEVRLIAYASPHELPLSPSDPVMEKFVETVGGGKFLKLLKGAFAERLIRNYKHSYKEARQNGWGKSTSKFIADGEIDNPVLNILDKEFKILDLFNNGKLPGYSNGKIRIKPSKRGTFTAAAKKHGASVREFESRVLKNPEKYSTAMVKKARFSRNARSWKH